MEITYSTRKEGKTIMRGDSRSKLTINHLYSTYEKKKRGDGLGFFFRDFKFILLTYYH